MANDRLYSFLKSNLNLSVIIRIRRFYDWLFPVKGKNNVIKVHGKISGLKKRVSGNSNYVDIKDSTLINTMIRIRGNNNHLIIEEGCIIGNNCSFWLEGSGNMIFIGKHTTMTQHCHLNVQEHYTSIVVGEDCMFSNSIVVRTSDSHPIYNKEGTRINPPNSIVIGNHVWIAPNSIVMKGAKIGNGCIVGSHSMANKVYPANCLIVGMPGQVVKDSVIWTRENILK